MNEQTLIITISGFIGGLLVSKLLDLLFTSAKESKSELKDNTIAVIKLTGRIEALESSLRDAGIPKMKLDLDRLWRVTKEGALNE